MEGAVRRIDQYQQRHPWLGFPFAVVKKFGDDRGGTLSALLAYYAFLALFPLLLLLVTMLGIILRSNPAAQQRVLDSAVSELPIIGNQLKENIHSLKASGAGFVFGVGGLVWGSLGLAQVGQHAMAEVWNVKGVDRPGLVARLARSLLLMGVLSCGVAAATALAGAGAVSNKALLVRLLAAAGSVAVNLALFTAAFRVLTPRVVALRDLVPGALVAGVAWTLLQGIGGYLVDHQLRHASQVYGFFGIVLGLFSFLSLAATLTLYSAEWNVVRARSLWPRSIVQPPLTEGDKQVLSAIAEQEERRPEQEVEVTYNEDSKEPEDPEFGQETGPRGPVSWRG